MGLYLRLYCTQFIYKRCIERATTVEAVGGSGYKPLDPATSKWVYFKGFSEETWWSVNPEPYRQEHNLSSKVYFTYFFLKVAKSHNVFRFGSNLIRKGAKSLPWALCF